MSELRVTACRVFLNETPDVGDRLKGFATIILNNEFAVGDLKIIRGNKGLFVAMPSRRRRDGSFHDVCHPIVHTLREQIESVVLGEYHQQLAAREAGDTAYLPTASTRQSADYLNSLEPYGFDDGGYTRR